MLVYVCMCMCMCVYVSVCMCKFAHVCEFKHEHVCTCTCLFISVCQHMCVYAHVRTYVSICMCCYNDRIPLATPSILKKLGQLLLFCIIDFSLASWCSHNNYAKSTVSIESAGCCVQSTKSEEFAGDMAIVYLYLTNSEYFVRVSLFCSAEQSRGINQP